MWLCENCKKLNKFKYDVTHIIKSHVEFCDSVSLLERKPILIVFVVDVSGSMTYILSKKALSKRSSKFEIPIPTTK